MSPDGWAYPNLKSALTPSASGPPATTAKMRPKTPATLEKARLLLLEHPRNLTARRALKRLLDSGVRVSLVVDISIPSSSWGDDARLDLHQVSNSRDWRIVSTAVEEMRSPPDAILSFSHHFCAIAARVGAELGVTGFDPGVLELTADKRQVREALRGCPATIPYWPIAADEDPALAAAQVSFPAVAKPVAETSSSDVSLVTDVGALTKAVAQVRAVRRNRKGFLRSGEILVEQYVEGPEFSVETMTIDGTTTVYGVTVKTPLPAYPFIEQADSFPCADEVVVERLATGAREVLSRLEGFSGPAHLEMRLGGDGPKLIELNPRQPGGFVPDLVRATTGRDIFLDTICGLLEQELPLQGAEVPAATWWQIYPDRAGRVVRCHVPDQVRAAEETLHIDLNVGPGDLLSPPCDNHGRIGDLLVSGEDVADSLTRAGRLGRMVEIALAT